MSYSMMMTWQRMPQQRRCKWLWIEFHKPVTTSMKKTQVVYSQHLFYRELQVGKPSLGGQKKHCIYTDTPKVSLKDFNILPVMGTDCTGSSKVALPHQKGSRQLGSKERVCKGERKRKERKARAKGSSSESLFSGLTCSMSNRQFRATRAGVYETLCPQHMLAPNNSLEMIPKDNVHKAP